MASRPRLAKFSYVEIQASEMALRREVVLHFRPSSEHPIAPRA